MYRHILLPTDGSRLAENAAASGIALARALGARVTAVHVLPHPPSSKLEAWAHSDRTYARRIDDAMEKRAHEYLETVREAAMLAGVPCECSLVHGDCVHREILEVAEDLHCDLSLVHGDSVHREILEVAEDLHCDLIVMASHGEKGDAISPQGSETVKAAMLGKVPVLVHHARANGR